MTGTAREKPLCRIAGIIQYQHFPAGFPHVVIGRAIHIIHAMRNPVLTIHDHLFSGGVYPSPGGPLHSPYMVIFLVAESTPRQVVTSHSPYMTIFLVAESTPRQVVTLHV